VFKFIFSAVITLFLAGFQVSFADEYAVVNIKSHTYHKVTCSQVRNCKSCIKTSLQRAKEVYGAKPCKICYKAQKAKIKHLKKHKHKKKYGKKPAKHKS